MDEAPSVDPKRLLARKHLLSRGYEFAMRRRVQLLGYAGSIAEIPVWKRYRNLLSHQFLPHYVANAPQWRIRLRRFGGQRTLPDFCVIGAIKSGTSDMSVNLLLHPNILPPLVKEYYSADPESWRIFYPTIRQKERHARRFGVALSPYLSPWLHWQELIYWLADAQPGTKIVLTLRDPAERMYSHWKWEKFMAGRHRAQTLPYLKHFNAFVDHALESFPEYPMFSACGFPALSTSIYWKAVQQWVTAFGRGNVLVIDVAEYFRSRDQAMKKIQQFVGLPEFAAPQSDAQLYENPVSQPPPDAQSMARLRAFFRPHNDRLWDLIGNRFPW